MAFMQCTAEQAEKFVKFLEASGVWKQSPAGAWEAFRLVKTRPTTEGEPFHSPLHIIVIHKNKKDIHSFDPLHETAFLNALNSDVAEAIRRGLQSFVGKPADFEAMKAAVLKALEENPIPVPECFEHVSTEVLPDGEINIRFKFPIFALER